ncbi:MAG TPA: alpha-ketoacid dehydrogenase subunit beta [Planctomycetes bacterium]|nr:alpha-ketoacid dehydrogenase subunit beta [Planctomycetota bacterium]
MTLIQAITSALRDEMRRNPDVLILGEDVGRNGGVFRATDGLQAEFGEDRVMDTPLCETGIIGAAIGMALYGMRPVPEIQFLDFIYPAFDQIVSELAKMRYRSGGEYGAPVVIRTPYGGGIKGGHYHSQSTEAYFTHTAGLKVVIPSNPYDAKGMLLTCLRQDDPVLFLEPKALYRKSKGEVPEEDYTVPLGEAVVRQEGSDMTLVCWGAMVPVTMEAAKRAEDDGISCEVLDLRTLVPLDEAALLESVKKTGRMIVVHEAQRTSGFGGELAAIVAEKALEYLEAPIQRVTGFDTPFPYTLEDVYMPDPDRILRSILQTYRYEF